MVVGSSICVHFDKLQWRYVTILDREVDTSKEEHEDKPKDKLYFMTE